MGMSWLKKVGEGLIKGAALVSGLSPLVDPFFEKKDKQAQFDALTGKVTDSLLEIQNVITTVEAFGQVTGVDGAKKLAAAAPLVSSIVMSKLVAGRKIKDKALFDAGVAGATDSIVKILNSLDDNDAKVE